MSLTIPKNQPIFFEQAFDCLPCASDYCIPVEATDTTPLYAECSDCVGATLISNGDFASGTGWTAGGGWAIGSGKATYTPGGSSDLTRDTEIPLTAGYYMIQVDITILSATGNLNLEVYLGANLFADIGSTLVTGFETDTYYLFGYIDTIVGSQLKFTVATSAIEIDNVAVYRLSHPGLKVKDCDTDEVFYSADDDTDITFYETTTIATYGAFENRTSGYAILTLDWDGMGLDVDTCYCLCVFDAGLIDQNLIQNGTFASSADWTITNSGAAGWSIAAGVASFDPAGAAGNDTMAQSLLAPLEGTLDYFLDFDIIAAGAWSITLRFGTAEGDLSDAIISGSGNSSQHISISGGFGASNHEITTFTFVANTSSGTFDIDNVVIEVDPDSLPCNESNCVSIKESWTTYCTRRKMCNILVTGTNTNDAFGFAGAFDFKGRIFGMIRNASYPDIENVEYKDLTGLKSLQYNDNEKIQELQVFAVPDGVHDWLRLALRCETLTLTINSTAKTFIKKGGDYTPNHVKTTPDSPVIVEIQEVQQVSRMGKNV